MKRDTDTAALRVGFAGLGAIGAPMARRILDAGFALQVWNRDPAKSQALVDAGAQRAASPAALARSVDLLCLCVTDGAAVEQLVFGDEGIAHGARAGLVVADHSTIHPADARRLAARFAADCGGAWVDAPVSGGVAGARAGTLSVLAGGAAADIERIRPVVLSFAAKLTHLGPAGSGQIAKACNQMISFGTAAVLAEALNLAARSGLDVARFPEAIEGGFADSTVLRRCAPAMLSGELIGSTLIALKDMEIALDLGRASLAPMPMIGLLTSLLRLLVSQGHTVGGLSTPIRLYADGPLTPTEQEPSP
ncbi:MAG TPA: NAD(P)-dependent oxidoreductase [Methylibium sp.]|jgi:3-hydroxyisobutyrate dehydrogenase|nr:NAD(P)-dependent oxidoreductase [Methylibium sp.]